MIVAFSLRADADIEDIALNIALDGFPAARRMTVRLYAEGETLADVPTRHPLTPGLEHMGVRRLPVGSYALFYAIREADVIILRVVHGFQDYPKLFLD